MRCFASIVASLCLTLAACSAGTCGQPQEQSEITLLPFHEHEIAPVIANGVPIGLILDTGAGGLSITPQAVADLKLTTTTMPLQMTGIGGTTYNQAAEIDDLKLGGASLSGAAAIVVPLSAADLNDFPAYGLLGQDLLTNWDLDFDAAHDKLALYAPQQCDAPSAPWSGPSQTVDIPRVLTGAATESADVAKGLIAGTRRQSTYNGEILFPVTLDGHTLTALLDTGASRSLVDQNAAGLDEASIANDPSGQAMGINMMRVGVHQHRFAHLVIGGVDEGSITAAVGPNSMAGADMLLGEDFLHKHRVYIAYHAGKLIIAQGP